MITGNLFGITSATKKPKNRKRISRNNGKKVMFTYEKWDLIYDPV